MKDLTTSLLKLKRVILQDAIAARRRKQEAARNRAQAAAKKRIANKKNE